YIPIASNSAASWKIENSDVDGDNNSYEKSPTLTKIELGGYELYRWMRISAATMALSTSEFERHMMDLISAEVIETLEKSFIDGTGTGQPKGLDNLTWVTGTNQILTNDASTPIAASDIAAGLALLPQKYARGAIILVNSDTLYNTISLLQGTAEYAFDLSNGAQRFMGKEIIVSEHMADDTIYIVNPRELYVRFAAPLAVESNRSSGFTQASIDLRALTVVDAAWNPKACVKVGLGGA
ncbi:MAG TPA: phage major capsid protein, partial [Tissierellia bacterium]|nr:phage major capsid protein [Tissierellia bacterium]